MREIKFRTWDKKYQMLEYDVSPDLLIGMNGKVYQKEERNYAGTTFIEYEVVNHYEIMQYTGLKDKNGKEIYEGDIIHMYSVMPGCDIDEIGIVKFIECAFLFEKTDGSNGWSIFNEATEIEVIGNTYENQELIKN